MITSGKSLSQQAEPLSNLQADFWSDKRSQSYAPSATEAAAVDDDQQPDDFPYDEWLVDQSPGNTNTLKAKKSNNDQTLTAPVLPTDRSEDQAAILPIQTPKSPVAADQQVPNPVKTPTAPSPESGKKGPIDATVPARDALTSFYPHCIGDWAFRPFF
ncbi:MAG: hypothetical protein LQ337_004904 [Flavoplaca oasis]|nr:MAG: hypothetical protein LQ337_004904 [Flavoplaca oasis]